MSFNKAKNLNGGPKFLLAYKFFKRLGGIFEEELKKLVVHLPNMTKGRSYQWPKVVVHKIFANFLKANLAEDWLTAEREKRLSFKNYMILNLFGTSIINIRRSYRIIGKSGNIHKWCPT